MEIHSIENDHGTYRISYKRTVQDVDGNSVEIVDRVEEKTEDSLAREVEYWAAQRDNASFQIDCLNTVRDAAAPVEAGKSVTISR